MAVILQALYPRHQKRALLNSHFMPICLLPRLYTGQQVAHTTVCHLKTLYLQVPNLDSEMVQAYNQAKTMSIKIEVSGNANTDIQEFIAECWAESRNSPTPRTSSGQIADIIKRRYLAKHP